MHEQEKIAKIAKHDEKWSLEKKHLKAKIVLEKPSISKFWEAVLTSGSGR